MMDSARLTSLLQDLVRRFDGKAKTSDSAENDEHGEHGESAFVKRMLPYVLRIMSSRLSPSVAGDTAAVSQIINKKLMKNQKMQDAVRVSELISRIESRSRVVSKPWAILYLLHSLSGGQQQQHMMMGSSSSSSNSSSSSSSVSIGPTLLPNVHSRQQQSSLQSSVGKENTLNAATLQADASKSDKDAQLRAYSSPLLQQLSTMQIPESSLIKDCLFVLQGIDGQYVKLSYGSSAHLSHYAVDPSVVVSPGFREIVSCIAECGWLYTHIRSFLDAHGAGSGGGGSGLVLQAFHASVQSHLAEYFRLVAILESSASREQLSLKKLWLWAQDPRKLLSILAVLLEQTTLFNVKGGALLSLLHKYSAHGDPQVASMIKQILDKSSLPLFAMIHAWMFRGELEDPFKEFFVHIHAANTGTSNIWNDRYMLEESLVPSLLPIQVAKNILLVGKTLHFIRDSCSDRSYTVPASLFVHEILTYASLPALVEDISKAVSVHLKTLLLNKFHLVQHLSALKRYVLLGQGDFIQYLMELLSPELSKPASQVMRHNVLAVLESAIRGSNAQFDDLFVLENLDVRLTEEAPGDEGWDVFSLDYRVSAPLDTIFSRSVMTRYLRVFSLLWKLKRVESGLCHEWKRHMTLFHTMQSHRDSDIAQKLMRPCQLLRNEMSHCIANLQYYLMFEVLEASWVQMMDDFEKANHLDDMIKAHQRFLEDIVRSSLLGESTKGVREKLRELVKFILKALQLFDKIYHEARNECERRDDLQAQMVKKTDAGEWGSTVLSASRFESSVHDEKEELSATDSVSGFPRHVFLTKNHRNAEEGLHVSTAVRRKIHPVIVQILEDMQQQFRHLFFDFFSLITSQKNHESLRFLAFRMDFNEFYWSSSAMYTATSRVPSAVPSPEERRDVSPAAHAAPSRQPGSLGRF
eukprot:ANDGO_00429.mRNA.1 Gamma-tubulin complex component 3